MTSIQKAKHIFSLVLFSIPIKLENLALKPNKMYIAVCFKWIRYVSKKLMEIDWKSFHPNSAQSTKKRWWQVLFCYDSFT